MNRTRLAMASVAVLAGAYSTGAQAAFKISNAATENVSCSNGLCQATADNANLNVQDLEALLAAGNVEIRTHGDKVRAGPVVVRIALAWSAATALTLDERLVVDKPVSINGPGILSLYANRLSFGPGGRVQCADLSCNVGGYIPVNSLQGLASAIATNPGGSFALVHSYNAAADGTYSSSPVGANLTGSLNGLGNKISNISVNNTSACCVGGLFLDLSGEVSNLQLANVTVVSTGGAAGFAYDSFGPISHVSVSGKVKGSGSDDVGGLVADNYYQIMESSSTASVATDSSQKDVPVGGLVGTDYGSISESFATGNVSANNTPGYIGGLAGLMRQSGSVSDSYATGAVAGGANATVGGLIGKNDYAGPTGDAVLTSYSIGAVSGGSGSIVGGFIGENDSTEAGYDYWDTTTSGTKIGVGMGNAANITGLNTRQLQSSLPVGFNPKYWIESADVNNGLPYLKHNSPPK